MSVQRIYVSKRKPHNTESEKLLDILKVDENILNIEDLTILNRYDVEGLSDEELKLTLHTVFSEPMVDDLHLETYDFTNTHYFSVEYLPGQYDQRADSAVQCVKVMTGVENVIIKCAKTYVFKGNIDEHSLKKIKNVIVNEIDQRIASESIPNTLVQIMPEAESVKTIDKFIDMNESELSNLISTMGLAMNLDDIKFSQDYFKNEEKRNPTETELKLLDTYWSDHCRHTTFNTHITNVDIVDGKYKGLFENTYYEYVALREKIYGDRINSKEMSLMDLGTIAAKALKSQGKLDNLEVSDENNACSIEIDVDVDGKNVPYLLQFKNETHNHPTEIEPFGGAATCIGGAIRDPLSGRAYVYQSMRISGASDPRKKVANELEGKKLSQRKITTDAAKGFSSYGNQIGLTTGYVQEFYHDGFTAKRLEAGAVIAACPKANVRREKPENGDVILLLGGRTGRDGIGGATGSSKEHDGGSLDICGAEVQKGNAPEEHKIQRLFRKPNVSLMIKKCNDFGAGGVGVAIGELADGLDINLNNVPKKYEGLSGTEIALSESQERMAVVIEEKDLDAFMEECRIENLECSLVAHVTNTNRLIMKHDNKEIVNISRTFLDSAGAARKQAVKIIDPVKTEYINDKKDFSFSYIVKNTLSDLNVCSQKGLVEMFDSTIGAGSVVTPFGGITGNTPTQCMIGKIPLLKGDTNTVSLMASGYNPYVMEWSPFHGAYFAIVESASKIVANGGLLKDIRLSFQEYFERLGFNETSWGKPMAALLGALKAQMELGIAAIGGKDSMSGTFKDSDSGIEINVPPTFISFAVTSSKLDRVITNEFKEDGGDIYFVKSPVSDFDLLEMDEFIKNCNFIEKLIEDKNVCAINTVTNGGIIESICKMSFGNNIGVTLNIDSLDHEIEKLTFPYYGSFVVQVKKGYNIESNSNIFKIGEINNKGVISLDNEEIKISDAYNMWSKPLEHIFPTKVENTKEIIEKRDYNKKSSLTIAKNIVKPRVAVLALPGTNCEYDTKRIFEKAGSEEVNPFVFRNMTSQDALESCDAFADIINNSQILVLPGGFSAGDEPEGSGKFYVSVLKNSKIRNAIDDLVNKRDGLVIGICNGFQALIKTGLLTYGYITDLKETDPTLSFNTIGRHVSQMVRTRVASTNSPWMANRNVGEIDIVPVSHGEGRFVADPAVVNKLFDNGQVLFQYVDLDGNITMESPYNPNGSVMAIEGICSPDGRVLGKMGHSERIGNGVHLNNSYGNLNQEIFTAGVSYFTGK